MANLEELDFAWIAEADDALEEPGPTKAPSADSADDEAQSGEPASTEGVSEPEISEEEAVMGESPYEPETYMGTRLVARSAAGTKCINTLEVLPHFELSI